MSITKSIRKIQREFDIAAARFLWKHPFLGFLFILLGIPGFILLCVCISTTIVILPLTWLLGLS